MAMTTGRLLVAILDSLPEASAFVAEHLDDNDGQVLLHLLVADLRRLAVDGWRHNEDVASRCLALLEAALTSGDARVQNAVAVSFVEDVGWWDTDVQPFLATWPPALAAEAERQRTRAS